MRRPSQPVQRKREVEEERAIGKTKTNKQKK
jgi:hypothetical protein